MTSRWFTSDLHLGDTWCSKRRYCGLDVDKMAATIAQRWDKKVAPEDEVFIVGDLVRGWSIAQVAEWLTARPGTKHVILGNWDRREEIEMLPVDAIVPNMLERFENEELYTLNHYPEADAVDGVLIHGHTHKSKKWSVRSDGQINVHVGWDAWRTMVHESQIVSVVRSVRMLEAEKERTS